jgi:hypothetical protein
MLCTKFVNFVPKLLPFSIGFIETLYHDDIIARLNAKQIATYNVDGSEGYNVGNDFSHADIGTNGE